MARKGIDSSVIWNGICKIARIKNPTPLRSPNLPRRQLLLVYAYLSAAQEQIGRLRDDLEDADRKRLEAETELKKVVTNMTAQRKRVL